jgi:glycosyltransferase involved in cell wall biosynthesis
MDESSRPSIDMVGDGVLRQQLAQYAEKHGLSNKIAFLGAKQSSWFIENAHQYSAMIAPFEQATNGDRDTGPVVVKEAMSLRLPVISTYYMGCKEMLTESCGLRAQPKDPNGLAAVIIRFDQMTGDEIALMVDDAYDRITTLYTDKAQAQRLSAVVEKI